MGHRLTAEKLYEIYREAADRQGMLIEEMWPDLDPVFEMAWREVADRVESHVAAMVGGGAVDALKRDLEYERGENLHLMRRLGTANNFIRDCEDRIRRFKDAARRRKAKARKLPARSVKRIKRAG